MFVQPKVFEPAGFSYRRRFPLLARVCL